MEQVLVGQENLDFLFRRGGITISREREQGIHLKGCYYGQLKVV